MHTKLHINANQGTLGLNLGGAMQIALCVQKKFKLTNYMTNAESQNWDKLNIIT